MNGDRDILRLHASWKAVEQRSVLTMSRPDWEALLPRFGDPVAIDVTVTPLAGVASASSVIAATAQRYSTSTSDVAVYRADLHDPKPVNVDHYVVWTDLASHASFRQILTGAGVTDTEQLRGYIRDNVFFVKQDPGPDHWLDSVPAEVEAVVESGRMTGI